MCRERAYLGLRTDRHGRPLFCVSSVSSAISAIGTSLARAPPSTQASPPINARVITDDGHRRALRSTRKSSKDSSAPRRGFMSGRAAQPPRSPRQVSSPRSRHRLPSAADAATRARFGRPAGGRPRRGRGGCPDAGHAVRHSVRSSVRPADVGPTGRADVRCPGDQWPRDACDPGVRTDRRPVSAAAASALSAPRWIPDVGAAGQATSGAPGSTGRCGLRAAGSSLPESGLAGRDCRPWPCAARTRVDGTPGPPLRIRTGWAPGSPPGRPRELVQRQGAGGLAGEHGKEQVCSQVPRRCVLGRLPV
jgi:hypothetical protein